MTEKHVLNWWTIGKSSINIPIQRRNINRDTPCFLFCPAKWCIHSKSCWIKISVWETYGSQHIGRTYVTYLKNTIFDSWNWNDAVGLFNGGCGAPKITITGGLCTKEWRAPVYKAIVGKVCARQICGHYPISGKMWFFWNKMKQTSWVSTSLAVSHTAQ